MNDEIKKQLANKLNVAPDEIMEYAQAPDGSYNVILFSFQKFTGVEPAAVSPIPEKLRPVYQNPVRGTKAQLIDLAESLNLDPGPKPTVKSLVKLIRDSKAPKADPVPELPAVPPLVAKPGHMQAHDSTQWSEEEE